MCKKAAVSEVGNAAAWPKPSSAAGVGQGKPPSCWELCRHAAPLHCDPDTASALSCCSKPGVCSSPFLFLPHSPYPLFQNHCLHRILSLQMNPAELTGWENRRSRSPQISAGLKPSSFGVWSTSGCCQHWWCLMWSGFKTSHQAGNSVIKAPGRWWGS